MDQKKTKLLFSMDSFYFIPPRSFFNVCRRKTSPISYLKKNFILKVVLLEKTFNERKYSCLSLFTLRVVVVQLFMSRGSNPAISFTAKFVMQV